MTYWDGTNWVPETKAADSPSRRRGLGRLVGATAEAMVITMLVFGLVAGTTFAAAGGNGGGHGKGGKGGKGGDSALAVVLVE